jgi:hypothetical protein
MWKDQNTLKVHPIYQNAIGLFGQITEIPLGFWPNYQNTLGGRHGLFIGLFGLFEFWIFWAFSDFGLLIIN